MKKQSEPYPAWEDFNKHEKRIVKLEKRIEQLLELIAIQTGQSVPELDLEPAPTERNPAEVNPSSTSPQADDEMSPALQRIVAKMKSGDNDGAFKEFQALPRNELTAQPVKAATIAAAICVTQGDFQAGIKALEQVQQFSDDPRIEQIKQKLSEQAAKG